MAIERLLEGNDTLYGQSPVDVAEALQRKLNELEKAGKEILEIVALPDYHHIGPRDGGIKDIFFRVKDKTDSLTHDWQVRPLRDGGTMHGWETPDIQKALEEGIKARENKGYAVRHFVMINDHHNLTAGREHQGGQDGVKNILLCYFKA